MRFHIQLQLSFTPIGTVVMTCLVNIREKRSLFSPSVTVWVYLNQSHLMSIIPKFHFLFLRSYNFMCIDFLQIACEFLLIICSAMLRFFYMIPTRLQSEVFHRTSNIYFIQLDTLMIETFASKLAALVFIDLNIST